MQISRTHGPYRGPDRRKRVERPPAVPLAEMVRQSGLILAGVMVPTVLVWRSEAGLPAVAAVWQSLAGMGFFAAGGALLISWKVGGRAVPARLGVGLVLLGVLTLAYSRLAALTTGASLLANPYGRLIPVLFAAVPILAALGSAEVEAGLKPLRTVVVSAPVGLFLLVLLGAVTGWSTAGPATVAATRAGAGLTWLAMAVLAVVARRRNPEAGPWLAGVLLVVGLVQVLAAALGIGWVSSVLMSGGYLAGASLGLTAGVWELRWTLRSQERYSLDLRSVASRLHQELQTERAGLDEQLHDLRNAVAGVRLADTTLRRHAGRLDEVARAALAEAVSSELSRLQALIEPQRAVGRAPQLLEEAFGPVVSTARAAGMDVQVDLGNLCVWGDRAALGRVLQNLLANARRYAPGSPVHISGRQLSDRVEVRVVDHGPGVPPDERDAIFGRGFRGSTAGRQPGSGLGLYGARRLAAEMGGALYLEEATGGGACFVVDLPASLRRHPEPGAGQIPIPAGRPAPAPGPRGRGRSRRWSPGPSRDAEKVER